MAHVVEFYNYTFPQDGLTFSPSFGDAVTKTTRLPGLDGGYDEYGSMPAPSEVGNISMSFTLVAQNPDDMQDKRDAVLALARYGKQRLFWTPQGKTKPRYCNARISNISMPQQPSEHTDLHQPVKINFQVSDPRWFTQGYANAWFLTGDGNLNGLRTLGGFLPNTFRTDLSEVNVGIEGNTFTLPVITLAPNNSGAYASHFRIQRKDAVAGGILDEFQWENTITYPERLVVNCRDYTVTWETASGNVNGFPWFSSMRGDFFRLEPGNNTLVFRGVIDPVAGPDKLDITVDYEEAWR